MNNFRRSQLKSAMDLMERAKGIIESCSEDESDYMDNMPENLQDSERYNDASDACETMDEVVSNLEDGISSIDGII